MKCKSTDKVIYIEHEPDFYTHTFRIDRENAPADAPVENLVLSPLSDGSWKEELITYHLTAQEKETMITGDAVDLKGKVDHTLLQSGTYAPEIMQRVICYDYVDAFYTPCSEGIHHNGEEAGDGPGQCQATQQSVLMVTVTRRCKDFGTGSGSEVGTAPGGFLTPPGGSEPSGPGDGSNPQPCSSVPSQPQDPSATIGGNANTGCNTGTPTLPILEINRKKAPCEKIKKVGKHNDTKAFFENLKTKTNSTKEFGELLQENNGQINNASIEGEIGQAGISFNISGQIDGFIHSHYTGLLSVFSPADLATLSGLYKNGNIKDPDTFILGLVTASNTQYMIVIDDITKFNIFAGEFITADGQINYDYIETYTRWNYAQYNILYNNLSSVNELGFVKFLSDKNSGLKVLKGSNNSATWEELQIKDGKIDSKPCN